MRRIFICLLVVLPAIAESQAITSVADRALTRPGARWVERRTPNADIYVLRGSGAEPKLARIASDSERAIRANLAWLGETNSGGRLRLFFVGSREEMRPFTGTRSSGWSIVAEGTAFFVANDSVNPAIRHETMHLLSWRLWGTPGGVWLSEGLATAAAGRCNAWGIDEIAAALYRDRQLATIAGMRRRFRTGGTQGAVHYISAGSLVQFIDRTWGRERLRHLWKSGMAGARQSLGASSLAVEQRWRAHVSNQRPQAGWPSIARQIERTGCE